MGWVPLVTMWQVLLDMPGAGNVPAGYGHMYSAPGEPRRLGRRHPAAQLVDARAEQIGAVLGNR